MLAAPACWNRRWCRRQGCTDFPDGGFAYPNLTFASQAIRATLTSNVFANNSMPEPTSLLLAGSGLAALRVSRKRG